MSWTLCGVLEMDLIEFRVWVTLRIRIYDEPGYVGNLPLMKAGAAERDPRLVRR